MFKLDPTNLLDWANLAEVIAYCKKVGGTAVVVHYPGRENYNITHFDRIKPGECVIMYPICEEN